MITVVADCYLAGVSTRGMDKLVKTLGIHAPKRRPEGSDSGKSDRTERAVEPTYDRMPTRDQESVEAR